MRFVVVSSVLVAASAVLAPVAIADPAHNSDEIVSYFAEAAEMGATRGLCIGTAQECDRQLPKPASMDMLITFGLDSAELTADARANLQEFARALRDERLRSASFVVEGHTDASGTEAYNDDLAERRAASVRGFLLSQGVEEQKITAMGMGERAPRTPDPYDPANRRVEMRIKLQ